MRPEAEDDESTVGDLLRVVASDPDEAWVLLYSHASAVASKLPRASSADPVEAVSEVLVRAFSDNARALRRCQAQVILRAWIFSTLRNVQREAARSARHSQFGPAVACAAGLADVELECLTTRQRLAFELLASGGSVAHVARALCITWTSARDLLQRGAVRLRHRRYLQNGVDRRQLAAQRAKLPGLPPQDVALLNLFASGRSYRSIGLSVNLTPSAVRYRVRRLCRLAPPPLTAT
mgnify:FL=1